VLEATVSFEGRSATVVCDRQKLPTADALVAAVHREMDARSLKYRASVK
jgi:hypothetical protein